MAEDTKVDPADAKAMADKEVEEKKDAPVEEAPKESAAAKAKADEGRKKEEAPKKEEPKKEKKEVEVPKQFKKFVEDIEKLTVVELAELVKVLEEKFDVSASVMMAAAPAGGEDEGGEEKSSFDVILKDAGQSKIQVIKAIREATSSDLKGAKEIADSAPKEIKKGVPKAEAEELKAKIEEAGGTVELA